MSSTSKEVTKESSKPKTEVMNSDKRGYVAKYLGDGRPMFVAIQGTEMAGKNIAERLVERWVSSDEKVNYHSVLDVVEVLFSQQRASNFMQDEPSIMSGPDMYHVVDSVTGNMVLNVWQPLAMLNLTVRVDQYKDAQVYKSTSISVAKLTMDELLKICNETTNKSWIRPHPDMQQKLVLVI